MVQQPHYPPPPFIPTLKDRVHQFSQKVERVNAGTKFDLECPECGCCLRLEISLDLVDYRIRMYETLDMNRLPVPLHNDDQLPAFTPDDEVEATVFHKARK